MTESRFRRHDLLAVSLLVVVITIVFADVIFLGAFPYFRDLSQYFFPAKKLLRVIVGGGEFPYWNPFFSGGQPLAANPEFEVFYPLQWLIFLPGFRWWLGMQLVLHVYAGALGMYFLLRSRRLLPPASFFGAITFGLGGLFLSYVNIPPFFFAVTWIPFVLLFACRAIEQRTIQDCALAGLFLGLILLAGEPTTILQCGGLIAVAALYAGLYKRSMRAGASALLTVALIVIAAIAVGAVQLFPAIDHVRDSVRVRGFALHVITGWSFPPMRPLEILFPDFMGHLSDSGALFWGKTLYAKSAGAYLVSIYVGILAGCLAVAGVVARVRGWLLFLCVTLFSYVVAIGIHTPLFGWLYDRGLLPSLRYPEKFILSGMLAVIIFSAFVADEALRGNRRVVVAAASFAAVLSAVAMFITVVCGSNPYATAFSAVFHYPQPYARALAQVSRPDWIAAAVRGAAAAALLFFLLKRGASRAWYGVAFLFLLCDLGVVADRVVPRTSSDFLDPPPIVSQLDGDRAGYRIYHAADLSEERVAGDSVRSTEATYWLTRNAFVPPLPSAWGYRTVLEKDYDASALIPTTNLYESLLMVTGMGRTLPPSVLFDISNVGYVLGPRPTPSNADPRTFTPVRVLRIAPVPRFYFADQMVSIQSREQFLRLVTAHPWSRHVAFVPFPAFPPGSGKVLRSTETANTVSLDVESKSRALLVIGVTPHKYWQATVDGVVSPLRVTNVGYQSLVVGPGRHTVRMRYRNPLIVRSSCVSAFSVCFLLLVAWVRPVRASAH